MHLESIAQGGDALGRFEGKSVFVRGGAPDEIVLCRVVKESKSWAHAELLEVIEPSPLRTDSACAFNKKCGGCNLVHIKYEAQLEIKTSILKDSFLRLGGFNLPEINVVPSSPFEYRNRMQFHCLRERSKGDSQQYGLMGQGGEIIAISDCPVAVPPIRDILRRGCKGISLPPGKDRFTVFSKDEVLLNEGGKQRGKIKLLEKEILIDAGVFFQSNCTMLEKLILELRKIAQDTDRNLPMADLYCGVGTFAVFLCDMFAGIILAEENKNAVSLARENLRGYSAEFFALRDTDWQQAFLHSKNKRTFGFAVVDPPRAGLSTKLAASLSQDGPPVLAYVSCDAVSLARDSKILTGGGYKLKEIILFDFYPQTSHIESLAVFLK